MILPTSPPTTITFFISYILLSNILSVSRRFVNGGDTQCFVRCCYNSTPLGPIGRELATKGNYKRKRSPVQSEPENSPFRCCSIEVVVHIANTLEFSSLVGNPPQETTIVGARN
jgi:hypothetical protein